LLAARGAFLAVQRSAVLQQKADYSSGYSLTQAESPRGPFLAGLDVRYPAFSLFIPAEGELGTRICTYSEAPSCFG
jgi:hypothetical protein